MNRSIFQIWQPTINKNQSIFFNSIIVTFLILFLNYTKVGLVCDYTNIINKNFFYKTINVFDNNYLVSPSINVSDFINSRASFINYLNSPHVKFNHNFYKIIKPDKTFFTHQSPNHPHFIFFFDVYNQIHWLTQFTTKIQPNFEPYFQLFSKTNFNEKSIIQYISDFRLLNINDGILDLWESSEPNSNLNINKDHYQIIKEKIPQLLTKVNISSPLPFEFFKK